ncbi:carboxypeptidase inhibitor SmCI-like [Ornithodoros turicata]|uniref:carboxypeptidase inhibitor SmCI-like n=1 Tax=Ornithodoros turicata TaxID=34597 RepID=UPI0031395ACE
MWAVPLLVGLVLQTGLTSTNGWNDGPQPVGGLPRPLMQPALPSRKTKCLIPPPVEFCYHPKGGYFYNYDTGRCQYYKMKCGELNGKENYFRLKSSCEAECQSTGSTVLCNSLILQLQCNNPVGSYYFNSAVGRCEYDPFGGCANNFNSFDSLAQCNLMCKADRLSGVCRQSKDSGPCRALDRRYYFDYGRRQCRLFYYGGCQGNANNFDSVNECERTCFTRKQKCSQRLAKGRCGESDKRWYFNTGTGQCVEFSYSGCEGNQNNFVSKEHCEAACLPVMHGGY